jgi:hypothetical protein
MNKNFQNNKSSQPQPQPLFKIQLANKPNKAKPIEKPEKNKFQYKPKIKHYNKAQNINQNNKQNKKNIRAKTKTKSKSKSRQNKSNIFPSINDENCINSHRINTFNQTKKIENNKINVFSQPHSFDKQIESDINNINFFRPCKNNLKINIIKKTNNNNNALEKEKDKEKNLFNDNKENTTNFENLKYIPLNDTSSLFNAWQNSSVIYKVFEEKLLKKNNFEIDTKTLEIKTKNMESSQELNDQKFWILYVEYLIKNNYLTTEKQFLSVINEAFTYMGYDCTQLRTYYLQKIKKYSPCFLPDGNLDNSDDVYFKKLNKSTYNFIQNQKGVSSSNIKIRSTNKKKITKMIFDIGNENEDNIKHINIIKDNDISIGNKNTTMEEKESDIMDKSEK